MVGRAGRGRLGRRPQPAVAGPGRARPWAPPGCRACSPRPAGRCSRSSTAGCWRSCSPAPAAPRCGPASTRCPTPSTSACCAAPTRAARARCPATARTRMRALVADVLDDATLRAAVRNLGGHDLDALRRGLRRDRRHPADGDLRLHAQGVRAGHRGPPAEPLVAADRRPSSASSPTRLGHRPGRPVGAVPGRHAPRPALLRRGRRPAAPRRRCRVAAPPAVPADLGRTPRGTATTQAALGRALLDLNRAAPEAAARVVTRRARTSARRPTSAAG